MPTVIVGGIPNDLGIPSVSTDVEELGRLAAGHLATECGCRSFLHVRLANSVSSGERHDAFARPLGDLGHHCENVALAKGRYGEDALANKSPIDAHVHRPRLSSIRPPLRQIADQLAVSPREHRAGAAGRRGRYADSRWQVAPP